MRVSCRRNQQQEKIAHIGEAHAQTGGSGRTAVFTGVSRRAHADPVVHCGHAGNEVSAQGRNTEVTLRFFY